MNTPLKIAMAQLNPTVGALQGNMKLLSNALMKAEAMGAQVLVSPELVTTGYPPEDLVKKPFFLDEVEREVYKFLEETKGSSCLMVIGTPWREGGELYNAALILRNGEIIGKIYKRHLPNYGVFDEVRFFAKSSQTAVVEHMGHKLGVMICEDMWFDDVSAQLKAKGAEALLVLNGSPFESDKPLKRYELARARALQTQLPLVYVNQVGGQDELVFDGASFAMDCDGTCSVLLPHWQSALEVIEMSNGRLDGPKAPDSTGLEAIYQAMVLGLKDYVNKNGFPGVVLGLSGGIDSALSAAVAVDALGAERVKCVMMPSPYTSKDSLEDAKACAKMLGVSYETVSIEPMMAAYDTMLAPLFAGREKDITEENIQSRGRGLLLMALSNKFGHMLLTTGNKSEMSVGYATIYGDMCGGYSVLKDVYKMTAFALSRWRNEHFPAGGLGKEAPVMPLRIITKPPSAELRADQKDEDSLPPYEKLDEILECLVEKEYSLEQVVALGHAPDEVRRIWRLLDRAEYKRRQAPPGVKLTSRAFGRDRRYPLTNGFTSLI